MMSFSQAWPKIASFFATKIRCSDGVKWTCAKMACGHGYLQQCNLKTCPSEAHCILKCGSMNRDESLFPPYIPYIPAENDFMRHDLGVSTWQRGFQGMVKMLPLSSIWHVKLQGNIDTGHSPRNFQQDVHLERVHVPLPCYIPFLECALQKTGWWIISTSSVDMFYPRTLSQEFLDWYGHSKRNWLGKQHGCGTIEHWHVPI